MFARNSPLTPVCLLCFPGGNLGRFAGLLGGFFGRLQVRLVPLAFGDVADRRDKLPCAGLRQTGPSVLPGRTGGDDQFDREFQPPIG